MLKQQGVVGGGRLAPAAQGHRQDEINGREQRRRAEGRCINHFLGTSGALSCMKATCGAAHLPADALVFMETGFFF